MKEFTKKARKFIFNNQANIIIGLISIVGIIIGSFVIGFFKSLLLIAIIDVLIFVLPEVLNKKKISKPIIEKKKEKEERVIDMNFVSVQSF